MEIRVNISNDEPVVNLSRVNISLYEDYIPFTVLNIIVPKEDVAQTATSAIGLAVAVGDMLEEKSNDADDDNETAGNSNRINILTDTFG